MADIITKAKLQLRVGNGEKVPMSPTKLLINHGKPNFTIQRSTSRVQENGEVSPLSPLNQANNNSNNNNNNNNNDNSSVKNNINHNNINNADNKSHSSSTKNNNNNTNNTNIIYNNNERSIMTANGSNTVNGNVNNDVKTAVNGDVIVNSNKFNALLKSTTKPLATKEATHQRDDSIENEAARVVLRRTTRRTPELLAPKEDDDDAVPEFIRRQRRIQERLAKENVLDFENRRSGYFTHVLISPTSPSRTSFVETMSSPAIVPSLEMAAPSPPTAPKRESEELAKTRSSENKKDEQLKSQTAMVEKAEKMEQTNGHVQEEQTIHEEGEEVEEQKNQKEVPINSLTEELNEQKLPNDNIEEQKNQKAEVEKQTTNGSMEKAKKHEEEEVVQTNEPAEDNKEKKQEDENTNDQTAEQVAEAEVAKAIEEVNKAVAGEDDVADEFTVSHTNEMLQTSVNTVEPISTVVVENVNGRNVVNIELPKQTPALDVETSVQHKSEAVLINQPNVVGAESVVIKVNHTSNGTDAISEKLNENEANNNNNFKSTDAADAELKALAQLKFEIKGEDAESVVVTPVLRTE